MYTKLVALLVALCLSFLASSVLADASDATSRDITKKVVDLDLTVLHDQCSTFTGLFRDRVRG